MEVGDPPARYALNAMQRAREPAGHRGDRVRVTTEIDRSLSPASGKDVRCVRTAHTAWARHVQTVPFPELGLRRLPARVEHLDVSVLLGRQCLQRRIERSKRIVAVKGGANHDVKKRSAPAGGGIAVGDERCLVCGLDRLGL